MILRVSGNYVGVVLSFPSSESDHHSTPYPLQSRCLEAAIFATGLRLRLRRLSARRLPSLGPDPAALAHPVEVPRGYAVACVWVLLGTGTFVGTRILFGPRASGPQTSFRMAPPRVSGARGRRV